MSLITPDYSRQATDFPSGISGELILLTRPRVLLTALVLVVLPALCVWMGVSSMWNQNENTAKLPAAFVNQDVPVMQAGRKINLGSQIVTKLEKERTFAFARYDTLEAARAALQAGKVAFVLLIPPDFSRQSTAADQQAQLSVIVSEGGNYTASVLGKRFGKDLVLSLNAQLNRERWHTWLGETKSDGSSTLGTGFIALQGGSKNLAASTKKFHAGSDQLHDGIARVARGAESTAENSAQLAEVASRLAGAVKLANVTTASLAETLAEDHKLGELASRGEALVKSADQLKLGLDQLHPGVSQLETSSSQLQAGAARVLFVGGKLSAGAAQVRSGVSALGEVIGRSATDAGQLREGLAKFTAAVQPVAETVIVLKGGLRVISEKLPPSDQLDLFDRSMTKMREGGRLLSIGLGDLNQSVTVLAESAGDLEKDARELSAGVDEAVSQFAAGLGGVRATQLAAQIETKVEVVAPVPGSGPALAPYFAALSLWLGALLLTFVSQLRHLPGSMRRASRTVRWFAKVTPLLGLGIVQATAIFAVFVVADVPMVSPVLVWTVALIGSVTFISLVGLLTTVLGDFGRVLAVLLLVLQVPASGGIYPIELAPSFLQKLHEYLPFTHLVRSFRATMFPVLNGQWQMSAAWLGVFALVATILGIVLTRWKFVARESYGSAAEV